MIVQLQKTAQLCLLVTTGSLFAGCLSGGGDSVAQDDDSADGGTPQYTADLSIFGPHPETSVKQSITEPRYMALEPAEREKVGACSLASISIMGTAAIRIAGAELYLDAIARNDDKPRAKPLGEAAKEAFHDHVSEMVMENQWPGETTWGDDMAETLGVHFAYKYWQEHYEANNIDLSGAEKTERSNVLSKKIREEAWPLCLASIPTECFEQNKAASKSCRENSIKIKELPGYGIVSDIYSQYRNF